MPALRDHHGMSECLVFNSFLPPLSEERELDSDIKDTRASIPTDAHWGRRDQASDVPSS